MCLGACMLMWGYMYGVGVVVFVLYVEVQSVAVVYGCLYMCSSWGDGVCLVCGGTGLLLYVRVGIGGACGILV